MHEVKRSMNTEITFSKREKTTVTVRNGTPLYELLIYN